MEKRQTGMNTELNLKLLVLKYSGLTDFKNDDCLEWDLGITGDDAINLLNEYCRIFNVGINNFKFENYFLDEGQNIALSIKRLFRINKKRQFSFEHLLNGINTGELI